MTVPTSKSTYATVAMKGGGYYSQRTRGAKDVIDNAVGMLEDAVVDDDGGVVVVPSSEVNEIIEIAHQGEEVEEVIKKEKPDGILLGFGGQTALNCGVELSEKNILQRNNVKVLGTPIEGIQATEDRGLFKEKMRKAGIPVPQSKDVNSVEEARKAAKEIGYPVIIRVAYTLGGKGGGLASNEYEPTAVLLEAVLRVNA